MQQGGDGEETEDEEAEAPVVEDLGPEADR